MTSVPTGERHTDLRVCGEAFDGNEAISMAHEHTPDLVIMDFAMPVIDGLKAMRERALDPTICPRSSARRSLDYRV
jgi:YesN/AraC family two-component response regulator